MNDATSNHGQHPSDTPPPPASTPRLGRRGRDRTPGLDLHGGQRPCAVYGWCDIEHEPSSTTTDTATTRHDVAADAAGALRLDGGLTLSTRLVDTFDDGDLTVHLELEHSVADDLSDLRTLVTVPLKLKHTRELTHRLDRIEDGEATHSDDAPIWLTAGNVSLAVQREEAQDRRHKERRPASGGDVVHLQLADEEGCTVVDLPIPLTGVPGLAANLGQLLGYAALSCGAGQ